ncbi:hypothetical protein [Cellvibrio fibrivorans]|uniref:Uncharacterized protein n=1 Tax=Cellvibrio fibrivorans TaxID=126350 RepID=A0ABU1UW04_9GAMM|nr:hypothetical protein [Cellvibrio fibrivorans]MDR7089341.1 hypothetical protein [Cellvibrio fibrivorans]
MSSVKRQDYLRHTLVRSLYILITGFSAATALAEENYVVAGSAYNLENNQLIYRELYTGIDENQSVRVDYVTPEGNTFASKTLVYQGEPYQPSFNYEDTRDNEYVSAQFQGARLVLTHGMNSAQNEKVIYDNARMVIDAGFDAYIQLNWDKLVAGKRLKFDFAMPNRLSSLQLEVRKIKGPESPVYDTNFGSEWIYFRITPAQKVISLFADPINLAYDPNGKYLMRFHGRSNIDDDNGGPQDVRIEYEYTN